MKWSLIYLFLLASCFVLLASPVSAQNPTTVAKYDVLELTYTYSTNGLTNPWEFNNGSNVVPYITAVIKSPSNINYSIDGFYYDTNTYKVRFTPAEVGAYSYTVTLNHGPAGLQTYTGNFTSTTSNNHGFLRPHPTNPHRFQYEDGTFFAGVGFNDCWGQTGGVVNGGWIDTGVTVDLVTYMQTYAAAGFHLFRWNPGNCSFDVYGNYSPNGNTYLVTEGKGGDHLLATAKANDFHTLFTFWWNPPVQTLNEPTKRAIRYALARYGAYVDMWEISNEQSDTSFPLNQLAVYVNYVRSVDPYHRLVTNSHPIDQDWTVLDFRSPHSYMYDSYSILKNFTNNSSTNRPVIVGEGYTGLYDGTNGASSPNNPWDVRTTTWTSFLSGLGTVWWNTSYGLCHCMPPNEYLGTQERQGVQIAANLFKNMNNNAQFQVLPSSRNTGNDAVTVYSLTSPSTALIYFFKNLGFNTIAVTTTTSINLPFSGTATWINPKTGIAPANANPASFSVTAGVNSITTPTFTEDLALRLISSASPSPTSNPPPLVGDLNTDGHVDYRDILLLLSQFNQTGLNIFTLNSVVKNYGQ